VVLQQPLLDMLFSNHISEFVCGEWPENPTPGSLLVSALKEVFVAANLIFLQGDDGVRICQLFSHVLCEPLNLPSSCVNFFITEEI
jgi:hypothetical protein